MSRDYEDNMREVLSYLQCRFMGFSTNKCVVCLLVERRIFHTVPASLNREY